MKVTVELLLVHASVTVMWVIDWVLLTVETSVILLTAAAHPHQRVLHMSVVIGFICWSP